jgi:hypothetical protein
MNKGSILVLQFTLFYLKSKTDILEIYREFPEQNGGRNRLPKAYGPVFSFRPQISSTPS